MECLRLLLEHLAWIEHPFLSGIRDSRKAGSMWGMMRSVGGVRKSIHWSWLAKGWGLGLLCWGFKGVQEEIPFGRGQHSSNQISGISTRTVPQSSNPSLSQTIWPRWTSRHFPTLPIVQTLLPVTFGYSLSSEAVVMRQLRRRKRLWRRSFTRSHRRTSMGPSRICWNSTTSVLQPEEILRRGLEFHVYTINKSTYTKKVWKLIVCTSYSHRIWPNEIYSRVGWKVLWLTKILSWNVTKWVLFSNVNPLVVYVLLPSVLQCVHLIVKKSWNSRYDVNVWTFSL